MPFSRKHLDELFENEISCVIIENFASQDDCQKLIRAITKHKMDKYPGVIPPIGRLGITQFEFGPHGKEFYLEQVEKARSYQDELPWNPLERVMELLRSVYPETKVDIMQEDDGKKYFAGLVRMFEEGGFLHFDYAPFDAGQGWKVGSIEKQLSWNLYLTKPDSGGECCVYNKELEHVHTQVEQGTQTNSNSYPNDFPKLAELIDGSQVKILTPKAGTLIFFNTINYHEIRPAKGLRLTMTSFIGKMPGGEIVLWS